VIAKAKKKKYQHAPSYSVLLLDTMKRKENGCYAEEAPLYTNTMPQGSVLMIFDSTNKRLNKSEFTLNSADNPRRT
jgi:hypothetical protein